MGGSNVSSLRTRRLVLEPLRLEDAVQVQPLFAQWEVVQYLNAQVPWPFPADGVAAYYEAVALPAISKGSEWHWTIRLRTAPSSIIGAATLKRDSNSQRGCWIAPAMQRHAYGTEAAWAITEFWFSTLAMPALRVLKATENRSSRSISERLGMRLVGTTSQEYVSGTLPTDIWEITSGEWFAATSGSGRTGQLVPAVDSMKDSGVRLWCEQFSGDLNS